jgi:hypothetical protein
MRHLDEDDENVQTNEKNDSSNAELFGADASCEANPHQFANPMSERKSTRRSIHSVHQPSFFQDPVRGESEAALSPQANEEIAMSTNVVKESGTPV